MCFLNVVSLPPQNLKALKNFSVVPTLLYSQASMIFPGHFNDMVHFLEQNLSYGMEGTARQRLTLALKKFQGHLEPSARYQHCSRPETENLISQVVQGHRNHVSFQFSNFQ